MLVIIAVFVWFSYIMLFTLSILNSLVNGNCCKMLQPKLFFRRRMLFR